MVMMSSSFVTITGVLLAGLVFICIQAQVPFLGPCPNKRVAQDFDVYSYLGRWYEIEKYFAIFEADGTCIEAYYSEDGNDTIGVMNTQINRKSRKLKSIQGTGRLLTDDGSAKLGVSFHILPFIGEAPYWVLDTDYGNYSIVWSCTDLGVVNFQIAWFLARERNPIAEVRAQAYDKMDEFGLRRDLFIKTSQSKCDL